MKKLNRNRFSCAHPVDGSDWRHFFIIEINFRLLKCPQISTSKNFIDLFVSKKEHTKSIFAVPYVNIFNQSIGTQIGVDCMKFTATVRMLGPFNTLYADISPCTGGMVSYESSCRTIADTGCRMSKYLEFLILLINNFGSVSFFSAYNAALWVRMFASIDS